MSRPEPRNPFYILLLLSSLAFVATALAYGLVPVLEQMAAERGEPAPPSPSTLSLAENGWKWLFWELGLMAIFAFLSMGLDRLRSLKKERQAATIPPSEPIEPSA